MPGVDGLKTGYYRETGFNIVATAVKKDLRLIVVVLGSPRARVRDDFALSCFKKNFSLYKTLDLVRKGEVIDQEILLPHSEPGKIKGIAGADFSYSIPLDSKETLSKEIRPIQNLPGNIMKGQKLATLVIKSGNQVSGEVEVVSPVAVPEANWFKRMIRKLGINL